MTKLKVPSLQHLARIWHDKPDKVRNALISLYKNSPFFNYDPILKLVRDMLVFNQPHEQLVECIQRFEKREDVRNNFLELLPLIRGYFNNVNPSFINVVSGRQYPIGRGLMVPFNPPLVYGVDGELHFPWFSFWRSNPVTGERLSLFVSIVDEILSQDPDLENAKFNILDFSAPKDQPRGLKVIKAHTIPRVTEERKKEMLKIFAEGFRMAELVVSGLDKKIATNDDTRPLPEDANQYGLFKGN